MIYTNVVDFYTFEGSFTLLWELIHFRVQHWSGLKTSLKLNKKCAECSVDVLNKFYARFKTDDISIPDLLALNYYLNMFYVDIPCTTLMLVKAAVQIVCQQNC